LHTQGSMKQTWRKKRFMLTLKKVTKKEMLW